MTLIDSKHIEQHLDEEKPEGAENESVEQIAFADRILLNKVDLVEEKDLERVEKRIKGINAFAPITRTHKSAVHTFTDSYIRKNTYLHTHIRAYIHVYIKGECGPSAGHQRIRLEENSGNGQ